MPLFAIELNLRPDLVVFHILQMRNGQNFVKIAGGATFAPKIGAKTKFLELESIIFGFLMKF